MFLAGRYVSATKRNFALLKFLAAMEDHLVIGTEFCRVLKDDFFPQGYHAFHLCLLPATVALVAVMVHTWTQFAGSSVKRVTDSLDLKSSHVLKQDNGIQLHQNVYVCLLK